MYKTFIDTCADKKIETEETRANSIIIILHLAEFECTGALILILFGMVQELFRYIF